MQAHDASVAEYVDFLFQEFKVQPAPSFLLAPLSP
jgi:hypothetical protein